MAGEQHLALVLGGDGGPSFDTYISEALAQQMHGPTTWMRHYSLRCNPGPQRC